MWSRRVERNWRRSVADSTVFRLKGLFIYSDLDLNPRRRILLLWQISFIFITAMKLLRLFVVTGECVVCSLRLADGWMNTYNESLLVLGKKTTCRRSFAYT